MVSRAEAQQDATMLAALTAFPSMLDLISDPNLARCRSCSVPHCVQVQGVCVNRRTRNALPTPAASGAGAASSMHQALSTSACARAEAA